jgi:hypothetical protein
VRYYHLLLAPNSTGRPGELYIHLGDFTAALDELWGS